MTRRFITADLENLTEGIRTLPWSVGYDADAQEWVIHATHPTLPIPLDAGTAYTAATADLFAAAPELAAELHRIRRELEERIRVWQKVADKLEASGDTDVAEVMRHVGRSAARILNGDNNE